MMKRQIRMRTAAVLVQGFVLAGFLLTSSPARAVDIHIGPRFWYATESLGSTPTTDILKGQNAVTNIDQEGIPLVGASVLIESKLDFIASFFWGSNSSDVVFVAVNDDFSVRHIGDLDANRYDAELLVRWRPKSYPIYLTTGLRYYRLQYALKVKTSERIPETAEFLPIPDQKFTRDLILWELGGGMFVSISDDASHRLIAGGLLGLGYNRVRNRRKSGQVVDGLVGPEYRSINDLVHKFAIGWDVNVGYQWQFHPKLNFVARYRAFGKSTPELDKHNIAFNVSHGPEIGFGYSF